MRPPCRRRLCALARWALTRVISASLSFVLAYIRSWRLALALSAILPCIGISGAIMSKFLVKYKTTQLKHVAESGSMAEEVISTIRTAQAFSTQQKLAVLFDKEVIAGSIVGIKQALVMGLGLGFMCASPHSCLMRLQASATRL